MIDHQEYLHRIFAIHQMKEKIINEIKEWEELHILKTPFDADISLYKIFSQKSICQSGRHHSYIVLIIQEVVISLQGKLPLKAARYATSRSNCDIGISELPIHSVWCRATTVADFSRYPEDSYFVGLKLPTPFVTTYKKKYHKTKI
ncbi:MAG: hypothetical protein IPO37_19955 [Saprospiraceae bacterium]|nr:hypothetical protein [Saprospiraceae bacterium]